MAEASEHEELAGLSPVQKAKRIARHKLLVASTRLPKPAQRAIVRRRHARMIDGSMQRLLENAYLGESTPFIVDWVKPKGFPEVPAAGLDFGELSDADFSIIEQWLDQGPYDSDALLALRTDNVDDEIGRVVTGLRLRLDLRKQRGSRTETSGSKVLFDARSLQSLDFGRRGIGRFARAALTSARAELGDNTLVLLVDHALEILPEELAGGCEQITMVGVEDVPRYSVLIEPSPMTASPRPLVPLLHSTAHKIAIVFDFIPMHYPSVYLRFAGDRVEYAAGLDALSHYDEFICISHTVRDELRTLLGKPEAQTFVAWPENVGIHGEPTPGEPSGPIVVVTGDEGRKNTYGALAAIGLATAGEEEPRDVLVLGMAGLEDHVFHWSIHAAMRPGETQTAARLTDEEMHEVLRTASVVLVPSFDEGLSLPVIEALSAGANVVASDIPAHRELIGRGSYLVDTRDVEKFAKAIRKYRGTRRDFGIQVARLKAHRHESLERVIATSARAHSAVQGHAVAATTPAISPAQVHVAPNSFSVGFATPWSPQKSGIADFSAAIGRELNGLCDLTVYTTADGRVDAHIASEPIDEVLRRGSHHDSFVTVVGNSHFHVPFIEVMKTVDSVVVAHDTRMIEFYAALRGRAGVEKLMVKGQPSRNIVPIIDDQLADMRLLQNAGMWEIARQSKALIMHSPSTAGRIEQQTGVRPHQLPFAAYRIPDIDTVTDEMRAAARTRLGFSADEIHLGSFGYIDLRTKMVDVIVEAAAWLAQWGYRVNLHLVGSAEVSVAEQLTRQAREAGIENFRITGFVSDDEYRDYILAVDLGIQLRVSPFLGVSGPLADMAAYGTTGMGSNGLAIDVDTPAFIDRMPDDISPLIAAEAIEYRLANPMSSAEREQLRREYLASKSPRVYAEKMLRILREVS